MKMPETYEDHMSPERSGVRRLLPIAGITAAVVAILAHLGGGAMLIHLGLGAGLAALGINVGHLGGSALVVGLVVVIGLKLLMVFGAQRWVRHRSSTGGRHVGSNNEGADATWTGR